MSGDVDWMCITIGRKKAKRKKKSHEKRITVYVLHTIQCKHVKIASVLCRNFILLRTVMETQLVKQCKVDIICVSLSSQYLSDQRMCILLS